MKKLNISIDQKVVIFSFLGAMIGSLFTYVSSCHQITALKEISRYEKTFDEKRNIFNEIQINLNDLRNQHRSFGNLVGVGYHPYEYLYDSIKNNNKAGPFNERTNWDKVFADRDTFIAKCSFIRTSLNNNINLIYPFLDKTSSDSLKNVSIDFFDYLTQYHMYMSNMFRDLTMRDKANLLIKYKYMNPKEYDHSYDFTSLETEQLNQSTTDMHNKLESYGNFIRKYINKKLFDNDL